MFIINVDFRCINSCWLENRSCHHFPSLIIIVASKVDSPVDTVGEQRVVISSCNQVYGILKLDLNWNALDALPPQSPLVIAPEGEHTPISGQHN